MYISKVIIKNYRSIKDLTLNLDSGKNIIVGKNNSGKSNIIKAIDIVLGENSPTYAKYNNIIESDFYSKDGNSENRIMIFCELKKNNNEEFDMQEIYKTKLYAKYIDDLYEDNDICSNNIKLYNTTDHYDIEMEENGQRWKNIYFKNDNFEDIFRSKIGMKNVFGFLFTAKISNGIIEKDLKLLVYNDITMKWTVFFNSQLRNILLQSAIIPAFREPKQQLSLNQWSWYGKMMQILTKEVSEDKWIQYEKASNKVSKVSNNIFEDVTKEINMGTLKIAFPNTKLFFKFLEEKKAELYKNTKIFVDDGFASDISLKGAGIQSSIIIGLYTYYVKNVSKIKNALLCLEEPELFLHPHGKRMISNRVNDFLSIGENQAIIVTHAEEFLELKSKNSKIIKIIKDNNEGTIAFEINLNKCREVILNNDNKEIFFADKIILCEGKEKILFEFINNYFLNGKFDDNNISIICVNGKNNFKKYIDIAKKINVKTYIVADFDYLLRENNQTMLKKYNKKYEGDISNLSLGQLGFLCQTQDNRIQRFINRLRYQLKEFDEEKFYKVKNKKEYKDFSFSFENKVYNIDECLREFENNNIFIQDSEIENIFRKPMKKMQEEDIFRLYECDIVEKEFNQTKLKRILKFFEKI